MVSSDSDSRDRHHGHRRCRSRDRDRSRSRSRGRGRERSRDRDFRPNLRSRSRSRSRSRRRSYRSRSDSRDRYQYCSPDSRYGYEGYRDGYRERQAELYHYREGSPPLHWIPGAGAAGLPGGEVPPWRAGPASQDSRQMQHWSSGGEAVHPADRPFPPSSNWGPPHHAHSAPGWPADDPYAPRGSRYHEADWDRARSRERSGELSRGGSEPDWDMQREVDWQRRSGDRDNPTASIFIKGLPDDAEEADIYQLFEAYPNLQSVKVLRDRMTGRSKGLAFVDFASSDDARLLMESDQRWSMTLGGHQLLLDYSHGVPSGRPAGAAGDAAQDWICDMCSVVNFARRLECYHCYTARPAAPRRVVVDLNEPSTILKISGLEPNTSEEALFDFCATVVPNIVDMRVIKDKYTGAPRGFAFVECPTIPEAGSLMVACQGKVLPGQSTPLKICYAKAKEKLLSSAEGWQGAAAAATTFGQAASAAATATVKGKAAGPLGWKPKEFDAAAVLDAGAAGQQNSSDRAVSTVGSAAAKVQQQQQRQQQPLAGAAVAAAAPAAGSAATTSGVNATDGVASQNQPSSSAAAAAAAGVDAATIQALVQAGFEFQPASGYWYDAKSGYHYDAKTQLYYHHSTNLWYKYDHSTGQYSAVGGDQQQQQQQQQQQGAQQAGTAGIQQQPAIAQAQQQGQKQPSTDIDKRRRAAVIGSAPQYNKEGLLAAAALAKEKEEEQKRIAAAKAARDRQQQQQNKKTGKQQQQLAPGKPGIGALPSTGAVAPPAAVPAVQVVADVSSVQGVVYKSKWAQRQR